MQIELLISKTNETSKTYNIIYTCNHKKINITGLSSRKIFIGLNRLGFQTAVVGGIN